MYIICSNIRVLIKFIYEYNITMIMFERIEIILSIITLIIGIVLVILQKIGIIFNNGKKVTRQTDKLESHIEKLKKEIYSDFEDETDKAHDTHVKIFEKLEELSNTVAYIKGMLSKKD